MGTLTFKRILALLITVVTFATANAQVQLYTSKLVKVDNSYVFNFTIASNIHSTHIFDDTDFEKKVPFKVYDNRTNTVVAEGDATGDNIDYNWTELKDKKTTGNRQLYFTNTSTELNDLSNLTFVFDFPADYFDDNKANLIKSDVKFVFTTGNVDNDATATTNFSGYAYIPET